VRKAPPVLKVFKDRLARREQMEHKDSPAREVKEPLVRREQTELKEFKEFKGLMVFMPRRVFKALLVFKEQPEAAAAATDTHLN
jgi:hypothetical protein